MSGRDSYCTCSKKVKISVIFPPGKMYQFSISETFRMKSFSSQMIRSETDSPRDETLWIDYPWTHDELF